MSFKRKQEKRTFSAFETDSSADKEGLVFGGKDWETHEPGLGEGSGEQTNGSG